MVNYLTRPQIGFLDATKQAIQKCVTFTGRARRSEFWWATLGLCIIHLLLSWIPIVSTLMTLFITLISLSLSFRRLHDTNHSGWLAIANFACGFVGVGIIFIGAIVGDLSFADLSEGEEYLAENLSTALMGVSAIYIIIGGLLVLASGILQLVILVFCCIDSDIQANKYGESPKYYLEETEQNESI